MTGLGSPLVPPGAEDATLADAAAGWPHQIAQRLVGGLYQHRTATRLESPVWATGVPSPVFRWWLFEGHTPALFGNPLAESWAPLLVQVRRLLQTHNPTLQRRDRPMGDVDWPRTLAQGPQARRTYVVRGSRIGLSDAERTALLGWVGWLLAQWDAFAAAWAPPLSEDNAAAQQALRRLAPPHAPSLRSLHRWASSATRARWPLFRHVVAPTLRCLTDGMALDQLPLPSERHRLFELLVLVELAFVLVPGTPEVRWFGRRTLDAGLGGTAQFGPLTVHWQHALPKHQVWTAATRPSFAEAARRFGLRAHSEVDLFFDLSRLPGTRFPALAIEAKSGNQTWNDARWQVWSYGQALAAALPGPVLAWGVSETGPPLPDDLVAAATAGVPTAGQPSWLFSSFADVRRLVERGALTGGLSNGHATAQSGGSLNTLVPETQPPA